MSTEVGHKTFASKPGEGRPFPAVGRVRVSSADTGGEFEVIELGTPPGGGGPPPHIHHEHDECFYIMEAGRPDAELRAELEAKYDSHPVE